MDQHTTCFVRTISFTFSSGFKGPPRDATPVPVFHFHAVFWKLFCKLIGWRTPWEFLDLLLTVANLMAKRTMWGRICFKNVHDFLPWFEFTELLIVLTSFYGLLQKSWSKNRIVLLKETKMRAWHEIEMPQKSRKNETFQSPSWLITDQILRFKMDGSLCSSIWLAF